MSRLAPVLAAVALSLTACDKGPTTAPTGGLPTEKLNEAISAQIGGQDTCVVIVDAKTGAVRYQYGLAGVCMRPLPPCGTFALANDLIGLDAGLITPTTVVKWDGKPQPVAAWQKDADMATAFKLSMDWWDAALAQRIGPARHQARLKAFGYGNASTEGPPGAFWMGPAKGGALAISTREQAAFVRRLASADLPVQSSSAAAVEAVMTDETRGDFVISGKTGSCESIADGSRSVGWWTGRLRSMDDDLVFAASIEGAEALPGFEVSTRIKAAFADAGLWPAE